VRSPLLLQQPCAYVYPRFVPPIRSHPLGRGGILGPDGTKPPPYGDVASNKGYVPSAAYIISTFKAYAEDEVNYMRAWLACLGGQILKLDHSFKLTKVGSSGWAGFGGNPRHAQPTARPMAPPAPGAAGPEPPQPQPCRLPCACLHWRRAPLACRRPRCSSAARPGAWPDPPHARRLWGRAPLARAPSWAMHPHRCAHAGTKRFAPALSHCQ
jgi:hypothetical protein